MMMMMMMIASTITLMMMTIMTMTKTMTTDDNIRTSISFLQWLIKPWPTSKASAAPSCEQNYLSFYDLYHIKV